MIKHLLFFFVCFDSHLLLLYGREQYEHPEQLNIFSVSQNI